MKLTGFIGVILLLGIAYILSNNRKAIKPRTVFWGIGLQLLFAVVILKVPFVKNQFSKIDNIFKKLISFSDAGSDFLFTSFIPDVGYHAAMVNFAFRALPVIIFFFKPDSGNIPFWYHSTCCKVGCESYANKHENKWSRNIEYICKCFCRTNRGTNIDSTIHKQYDEV